MTQLSSRFYRALCLCAGERSVKIRLANAWIRHLDNIDVQSLPAGARPAFSALHTAMSSVEPMPDEHPARAAARKLSVRQATEYARSIAAIYREILQAEVTAAAAAGGLRALEVTEDELLPDTKHHLN